MFNNNTDREWEIFGGKDPYYGVVTHDVYRTENITDEDLVGFFNSGVEHIDHILNRIRNNIDPDLMIRRALDFGCGVGRMIIPLAEHSLQTVGLDVSESMLKEAKKNCEARSIDNVEFIKSDDRLTSLRGKFDFIHSYIVFQHIPVERGLVIFENLLGYLSEGGICVVHFTYKSTKRLYKYIRFVRNYFPFANNLINLTKGRSFFEPHMQMNEYDLSKIYSVVKKFGLEEEFVEHTNHSGFLGVLIYLRKPGNS